MTTIITNNKPRNVVYGYELPHYFKGKKLQSVLNDLDYYTEDALQDAMLFIYKGNVYDIGEFMRVKDIQDFNGWHGYKSDSFFSGMLIKLDDNGEFVTVARYLTSERDNK